MFSWIKLPELIPMSIHKKRDALAGIDELGRTMLETYRNGYAPMPTSNISEFAAFFSKKNYGKLYKEVVEQAGGLKPEPQLLLDAMAFAFQVIAPRSDQSDPRLEMYGPMMTKSYVDEMNVHVLDRVVPEVIVAEKTWRHYQKYRNGPVDIYEEEKDWGVDTRSRYSATNTTFDWLP